MDIDRVRRLIHQGTVTLRFTDHAITEARKDGLTVDDLEQVFTEKSSKITTCERCY